MHDDAPDPLSPAAFGTALKRFLDASLAQAPPLRARVVEHLGTDPAELHTLARDMPLRAQPNLQVALDALLARPGWSRELIGMHSVEAYLGVSLTELIQAPVAGADWAPPRAGPLEHDEVDLEPGRTLACVTNGLYLVRGPRERLAAVVSRRENGVEASMKVEVVAARREEGERFLQDLRSEMRDRDVYRGHVLAFTRNDHGEPGLRIQALPFVDRDDIVLPLGTLERIERHVLVPTRHRERLLAAGRHLKRGLLLHGPPGTGKTLTTMHILSRMPGRTAVLLSGEALGAIEEACALARELEPSTVVLEDVDLVGEERTYPGAATPLLFELLNQMDGLAGDVDVLFVLTTNRPDLLEPALAARPGRVDQAVEVPLPDADGRRRLIELYARGLTLRATGLDRVVERTEGASAALLRELLRKAAVLAADEAEGPIEVDDRHLELALDDLSGEGGELTRTVLGNTPAHRPERSSFGRHGEPSWFGDRDDEEF